MMNIGFFLKEPKKTTETMVYITATINGKRFKRSTSVKIKPTQWAGTKVRPLAPDAEVKNLKIDNLVSTLKGIERDFLLKKETLTKEKLEQEFDSKLSNVTATKIVDFFDLFEQFINSKKATNAESTLKTYRTTKKHIKEFAEENRLNVSFDSIDLNFYDELVAYFIEKDFLNSVIGKYIKNLKTFLNWAFERDYHKNLQFKKFEVFKEDSDKVILTSEIVEKLRTTDFEDLYKNIVRDIFIISAYTGLRFIDIEKLKLEDVTDNFIRLHIQKTREIIEIPLLQIPKNIIADHAERFEKLKVPTNQFCNREIKNLFAEIGFNDKVKFVKHSGQKNILVEKDASQYLTMHYGRVFFITNSLMNGMNEEFIRKITGHKDYKSFKKYIRADKNMVAQKLKSAWEE